MIDPPDELTEEELAILEGDYQVETRSGLNFVGSETLDTAECRFCREAFETLTGRRSHTCEGVRNMKRWNAPDSVPLVEPRVHEMGAKLMWAAHGLSPYYAIVKNFDRILGTPLAFEVDEDTWKVNHDEKKVSYWKGAIAAEGEDYDAYNEYNIGVVACDEVSRRRVNFQFRPGLPNAKHAESSDRINSLPEDTPECVRVEINSANVDPAESIDILHGLMDALTIDPAHFRYEDIHGRSRVYNLALYLRIRREISEEKIVSRNGLLEKLAMVSSQRRGRDLTLSGLSNLVQHRPFLGKLLAQGACVRPRNAAYLGLLEVRFTPDIGLINSIKCQSAER